MCVANIRMYFIIIEDIFMMPDYIFWYSKLFNEIRMYFANIWVYFMIFERALWHSNLCLAIFGCIFWTSKLFNDIRRYFVNIRMHYMIFECGFMYIQQYVHDIRLYFMIFKKCSMVVECISRTFECILLCSNVYYDIRIYCMRFEYISWYSKICNDIRMYFANIRMCFMIFECILWYSNFLMIFE